MTLWSADRAWIVRVQALSLWPRASSAQSRRALCVDRACRSALAAREAASGSCLVVCAPAFAIPRSRVRCPHVVRSWFGLKIATLEYTSSTRTRSKPSQLRLENCNVRSTLSRFGWRIATFEYESSMRGTLSQLRLENHNFGVRK